MFLITVTKRLSPYIFRRPKELLLVNIEVTLFEIQDISYRPHSSTGSGVNATWILE
jgi:hypothetical protein